MAIKRKNRFTRPLGHTLKDKRILITAGPTWVPLDKVRVISNLATGETGLLIAREAERQGARVTVLAGPTTVLPSSDTSLRIVRFTFFDELKSLLNRELRVKHYDILIHSAAVSDYRPSRIKRGKVKSGMKGWRMTLVPTEKIIDSIKKINSTLVLVGFKFEPGLGKRALIHRAKHLIKRAHLDLAVANTIDTAGHYQAHIIDGKSVHGPFFNKKNMVKDLIRRVGEKI